MMTGEQPPSLPGGAAEPSTAPPPSARGDAATRQGGVSLGCFALLLAALLVFALPLFFPSERWTGTVYFTGLDDSAQCALARSMEKGAPLVFHDKAFAAVPERVRPALLYRPAAARKTRDLAHQVDPRTFISRPFFQPFLPMLRARAAERPGLAGMLALLTAIFATVVALRGAGCRRRPRSELIPFCALLIAPPLLIPWLRYFPVGPFAEGPATLFAMFALTLAFFCGRTRAATGIEEGLLLGFAATFHPTLAAYAIPIGLFSILRRGSWRHTLLLLLGVAFGLAPLVFSTRYVTAPYGNFLDPATLRTMIRRSADIRALVIALAAVLPFGIAALALAHVPRLREAAERPGVRTAIALASAFAIALSLAFALLHPAARRALATDRGDILLAIPHLVAAIVLALSFRRPATCALLAGCALAALPFFIIQGQEVHVGIWSLRRALPPFAILPLAAFLGAFETDAGEAAAPERFRRRARIRRWWVWLLLPACALQVIRMPTGFLGELGSTALVDAIEARLEPGAMYVFERIPETAPFAALPGRAVFGLNDRLSNALRYAPLARWLRKEAAKRPVYIVAFRRVERPIPSRGLVLVPEGEPVSGTVRRFYGKTFRTASETSEERTFTFLRVRPATSPEGRAALADGVTLEPGAALPFGLERGAWDIPRRDRTGRWAADGAGFWGPVPAPGETVRFRIRASWWTRDGTNAPPQTLRLEPPFAGNATSATLAPSADPKEIVLDVTRDPDVAAPGVIGLYRLRGSTVYNERGFPPALIAEIHAIRSGE